MSSSRGGGSSQGGGRGRGERGGGSRLHPGAFDLSDGESMSQTGTNFTLPQAASATSGPSTQPGVAGTRTVTAGGPSFSDFLPDSQVGAAPPLGNFAFDDDDDEGYEMPTLDDAQKESTAGVAASRQPRGSGVAVAVAALGGGVTPTASRLGSLLARSDGGSALSEGGVTFMLPDVTTATGAMYAQMDEKDFDQVFATKFLKAAKTNLYEEGPTQAAADTARSYAYQMGGQAAIQGMRDALLPSEQAQSAGQALARRVLERYRLAKEQGVDFAPAVGNLGIRRFRNAVRAIIQKGKTRSTASMRMHPTPLNDGPQRGYVLVEKQLREDGTEGAATVWKYFVQDELHNQDQFMFIARKDYSNMLKTQFIIGTNPLDIVDYGPNFYGRVVGNFMGSEYTFFDKGMKLSKAERKEAGETKDDAQKAKEQAMGKSEERSVLGSIKFEGTLTKKSGGYRRSTTVLPGTYDDYFGNLKHKNWDLMDDVRDMHILTTKVPTYKKINGQWVYCYKWGGRVRMPSTRNFQLTLHGDAAATVVMFGKTDEGLYSLDYTYPLSAFQAFCLALTSFDNKLCMLM